MNLTAADTASILDAAGLGGMDDGLFALRVTALDKDGRPFGQILDADDETLLGRFAWGPSGWWTY